MDYVSEEAEIAGRAAASFLQGKKKEPLSVSLRADGKIRYTVPKHITAKGDVTVYFRTADVYRDATVEVKTEDGEVLLSLKKTRLAPAEMETVKLKEELLLRAHGRTLIFTLSKGEVAR